MSLSSRKVPAYFDSTSSSSSVPLLIGQVELASSASRALLLSQQEICDRSSSSPSIGRRSASVISTRSREGTPSISGKRRGTPAPSSRKPRRTKEPVAKKKLAEAKKSAMKKSTTTRKSARSIPPSPAGSPEPESTDSSSPPRQSSRATSRAPSLTDSEGAPASQTSARVSRSGSVPRQSPSTRPVKKHRVVIRSPSPSPSNSSAHSDSDSSRLSQYSCEDDEEGKIEKPPGEPGRPGSGGYNLKKALGWKDKEYRTFQKKVHHSMKNHLNEDVGFSRQNKSSVRKVQEEAVRAFPDLEGYASYWPVTDVIKLRLKYLGQKARRK